MHTNRKQDTLKLQARMAALRMACLTKIVTKTCDMLYHTNPDWWTNRILAWSTPNEGPFSTPERHG